MSGPLGLHEFTFRLCSVLKDILIIKELMSGLMETLTQGKRVNSSDIKFYKSFSLQSCLFAKLSVPLFCRSVLTKEAEAERKLKT